MAKQHFLVIDTETALSGKVADFGAVLCDRKGHIIQKLGVLIEPVIFKEPLFYNDSLEWSKANLDKRTQAYQDMLNQGSRFLAGVAGVNSWLAQIALTYRPILTAYNLGFDLLAMKKTGIDSSLFPSSFCLWAAASHTFSGRRKYLQLCLDNHKFTNRTKAGFMAVKTDCETMAHYCGSIEKEPHLALEDAIFELTILKKLLKGSSTKKLLAYGIAKDWRLLQIRDLFKPR